MPRYDDDDDDRDYDDRRRSRRRREDDLEDDDPPDRSSWILPVSILGGVLLLVLVLGLALAWLPTARDAADRLGSQDNLRQLGFGAAAARSQSQNHLKQIGIGLHNMRSAFEDRVAPAVGMFPRERGADGTIFYHLLPFIEQDNVYRAKDLTAHVKVYASPADPSNPGNNNQLSYAANLSVFTKNTRRMFAALSAKGESNTIIFCERFSVNAGGTCTWGDTKDRMTFVTGGTNATTVPTTLYAEPGQPFGNAPLDAAHCYTSTGCQVLLGDGSARNVAPGNKGFAVAINAFDNRAPAIDW